MNLDFAGLKVGVHRFHHACKPGSSKKPLKVTVEPDGAVWFCHRCGERGCSAHGSRRPITSTSSTAYATLSAFGRALWSECEPLSGIALEYLRARNCFIPPADGDLRWHPNLRHPSGYIGAALVGLVTAAVTNEPISLHRTWIRCDGSKAPVEPARMLLKDHKKAGAAIRLWPDEAVAQGLAVAEGIETALAAAHAFTPVWAMIDAGNLAAFPVLAGITALAIFADHDEAGIRAANACARRWGTRAEVTIITPKQAGADIADVLAS